jgi:hypothetical protein
VVVIKAKSQRNTRVSRIPLALSLEVSWQSGRMHPIYTRRNGVHGTVRGFESRTHRQNRTSLATALTAARELIHTAEAAQTRNLIMWPSAVELNRRFHSDVPFLQNRNGEGRKGPK